MLNMLAVNQPLTAEQRIQKAVVTILNEPRFVALSGVLMLGKRSIAGEQERHITTAATNGRDEWYCREFVDSLSDAELRFVILHETYHKIYRHPVTWAHLQKEDPRRTNMACDYVINLQIVNECGDGFAVMPEGGLLDYKYTNMDTAQVYHLLKSGGDGGDGGDGDGDGAGAGDDTGETLDNHDWAGAENMSEEEAKQLTRDIDQALRQGLMSAGKTGSGGNRTIEEILEPEVDWREALREFVSETCRGTDDSTWRRPERRLMTRGILRPSGISERTEELIFANDLSASVHRELGKYMGEIAALVKMVNVKRVRVLYWDTKVCREEVYGEGGTAPLEALVSTTRPEGGGGTDVSCVCDYIAEHKLDPSAVIVFTDGYLGGQWGTWRHPLMWCLVDNASAKPTVGKYVHVKTR